MNAAGSVSRLLRYPIKSVGGEALREVYVEARGLTGDRLWAVEDEDGKFGSGKSTRRFRRMEGLLEFAAALVPGQSEPTLTLPSGAAYPATSPQATAALRERTGRTVSVTAEREVSHFDEGAIHLLTTSALGWLAGAHGHPVAAGHFRPNILLNTGAAAGHLEESWLGQHLSIGSGLVLKIVALMPRCVMVNMAQPGVTADPGLLKSLSALHPDVCFGVLAHVARPGTLRLGDPAHLL